MDDLGLKIRQMHMALDSLQSEPSVKALNVQNEQFSALILDFGTQADQTELANRATLLVATWPIGSTAQRPRRGNSCADHP